MKQMQQGEGRNVLKRGDEGAILSLLRTIFVSELLTPSSTLWIVSPWLSDVPILDNRLDGFRHLEPTWPRAQIRLGIILATLADRGTHLVVATRPARRVAGDEGSRATDRFLEGLQARVPSATRLTAHRNFERLHTKGLLGDGFFLAGSMNFTFAGVKLNDEFVRFTTATAEVSGVRIQFRDAWSRANGN